MPPASDNNNASSFIKNQLTRQGYDLVALLGKGGSGIVWLAEDQRLNRKVAIKLLHTNTDTQNQIVEEARLLAKFNHPGVVQIYDILSVKDEQNIPHFAIVMEYIEGRDLLSWLREKMPDTDTKLSVLLQLSQTLAYIHQQDIVHGDLKPANILLRGQQPVITDFGEALAKAKREQQAMRSTQSWSAPEVQSSGSLSPASDAYSFALLAVWLLSHWHPGEADASFNLDEQAHTQFLQQFDSISQGFPNGLALQLQKLLTWQADARLRDFALITLELQQIIRLNQQNAPLNQNTELLEAAPNSTPEPKTRARPNQRWWLAGVAVLMLAALSAGVFVFHQGPQTRFIALLPPEVTGGLDTNREQLLASAVSHAIENNIINNKDFLLIPSADIRGVIRQAKEQEDGPLNLTKIVGNAMGATDVISIALDCAITHCDVALSRSEKSGTAKQGEITTWTTSLSDRFSTPLVDNLRFSDAISQRFPRLFRLDGEGYSEADNISEEAYSRYLEIVRVFRENEGGGDLDGLLEELEELIEAHPDFYSWYWLYKEVALKAHHYSKEKRYINSANKILNYSPKGYKKSLNFAIDDFWINLIDNKYEKAGIAVSIMQELNQAAEVTGYYQSLLAFYKLDFTSSIEFMENQSKFNKSSGLLHNLALSYWYLGKNIKTIEILEEAINLNPYSLDLKQLLGAAYLGAGKLSQASDTYVEILKYTESSTDLSNLSVAQTLLGDYELALINAKRAVELRPSNPELLLNYADTLKLNGAEQDSANTYSRILELVKDKSELNNRLVFSQAAAHLGMTNTAIQQIESAKKEFPENSFVLFTAALVYALLDRNSLSQFHLEEAISLGFDPIWFSLPWFKALCEKHVLTAKLNEEQVSTICSDKEN